MLNEILCLCAPLRRRSLTPLRLLSLEMTENKRPPLISGTYIIRFFTGRAVVAAWLIATTTMDIFYNGRGGRHERLEIHLLPRETQSNPVGWEERTSLFFLIFHRKLISRVSPSGRDELSTRRHFPSPLSVLLTNIPKTFPYRSAFHVDTIKAHFTFAYRIYSQKRGINLTNIIISILFLSLSLK